jgi:glycosyltransferase involved in cell wall biosynthesis
MKVLFLCILMGNPYAERLAKSLELYGVDVQIEEYNFSYFFLPKVLGTSNVKVLHLHTLHYFLTGSNALNRWIRFFLFVSQILILKILGIKIVWTVHEWADRFGNGKNRIYPIWSTILGRLLDAIITHCNTTKIEIDKAFRLAEKNRIFVVPHGNYIGSYENQINQDQARRLLNLPKHNLVFLLFGDIHRTKGFLEAVDAFKALEAVDVSLLIVGQPVGEQLEEELRNKIDSCSNIVFISRRAANEEIQCHFNASNCVIVPYKVSTTSGVTILSMSFGKACIAPKVGFFQDVLDTEGAFLYDSNSETGLLDAMRVAVEKRDALIEMGNHNLKLARQWDWDTVGYKTANVYMCRSSKKHALLEGKVKMELE